MRGFALPAVHHVDPILIRIGTCRKKVMGLLRLMGNKADVVKGLAKRCNENWSVAPKSDIVSDCRTYRMFAKLTWGITGTLSVRYSGSFDHDDAKLESLRKDSVAISFQLPGSDLD